MIEITPIPDLAKSAIQFVVARRAEFDAGQRATVNALGAQTLEVMGLSPEDGWSIDFDTGMATRSVADPVADPPAPETAA